MFRSAGVGDEEGTAHILGARLGVYCMYKLGAMPPFQAGYMGALAGKRSREGGGGEE